MAAKKPSKNNPTSRVKILEPHKVVSSECENCKTRCENYFKYMKLLQLGKIMHGVNCSKV